MIRHIKLEPIVVKKKWVYQTHTIQLPPGWSIAAQWTANGFQPMISMGWAQEDRNGNSIENCVNITLRTLKVGP